MNYDKHYCIEVHHQYGVKVFDCENFWDVACDEINYTEYENIEQAASDWGSVEEVPAELAELLKSGPVIEIATNDSTNFYPAAEFDRESFSRSYLAEDLNRLIVIDSEEEARKIAENYKDHEWIKVRAAAREIIESNRGL